MRAQYQHGKHLKENDRDAEIEKPALLADPRKLDRAKYRKARVPREKEIGRHVIGH